MAGPGGAGKTSLLQQYVKNSFSETTKMTIGVDFFLKELRLGSDVDVSLQLWDFGGQRQFREIHGDYVKGARGALLLVDLTRIFEIERVKKWVDLVRFERDDLPIVLIGNKVDLQDLIKVKDEELKYAMEEFNMETMLKTSAKTGKNVDKAFDTIAEIVYNHDNS